MSIRGFSKKSWLKTLQIFSSDNKNNNSLYDLFKSFLILKRISLSLALLSSAFLYKLKWSVNSIMELIVGEKSIELISDIWKIEENFVGMQYLDWL